MVHVWQTLRWQWLRAMRKCVEGNVSLGKKKERRHHQRATVGRSILFSVINLINNLKSFPLHRSKSFFAVEWNQNAFAKQKAFSGPFNKTKWSSLFVMINTIKLCDIKLSGKIPAFEEELSVAFEFSLLTDNETPFWYGNSIQGIILWILLSIEVPRSFLNVK